ncbi:hypothetical protein NE237_022638 [Protea cynaroides]|uniref:Uncharacterized protein n=1 Tax=Protea cynaroides TaxID=273540 RepID=A0A9Q0HBE3_9MAGN|nr:hypothetical protein NE237_022638 [Protea cynaroides]
MFFLFLSEDITRKFGGNQNYRCSFSNLLLVSDQSSQSYDQQRIAPNLESPKFIHSQKNSDNRLLLVSQQFSFRSSALNQISTVSRAPNSWSNLVSLSFLNCASRADVQQINLRVPQQFKNTTHRAELPP